MTELVEVPPELRVSTAGGVSESGLSAGTILSGRYRVLERLGAGGMGEVYAVEHLRIGRCFAAKILRAELARDPSTVRRFTRETREVAKLASEHVVSVVDSGTTADGVPFLVMEQLRGCNLRELLEREGPLAVPRAVGLCLDVCLGLRVAHAAGLVHRDLKPANLFVTRRDGGEELCKILDFGIARLEGGESTEHGPVLGTARYMAPEQLRERGEVDRRTDIYALGSILYECLAGRPPHQGERIERIVYAIMNERPRPLAELVESLPAELSSVVARAIERNPSDRFANADEFIAALSPLSRRFHTPPLRSDAGEVTANLPGATRQRARGASRRGVALVGLAGTLVASAAIAWQTRAPRTKSSAREPSRDALAFATQAQSAPQLGTRADELRPVEQAVPPVESVPSGSKPSKSRTISGAVPHASQKRVESAANGGARAERRFSLFDTASPYVDEKK